ncbi:16372_t:CDS:2, partial [Dentiscutata erythropus]
TNMSDELHTKVYNFIVTTEEENVTATTVIYQAVKTEPWTSKEEVRKVVYQAISLASNIYAQDSSHREKLSQIPLQFEMAYEGVHSLLNIGALKVNKVEPLTFEQIDANLQKMKLKLSRDSSPLSQELALGLRSATASNLEWTNPLANQIIDQDSDLVKHLSYNMKKAFLKPARRMVPPNLPMIREMCKEFVKLDQNNKENINLKDEVMKLRNDIEEIKKKDKIITNTQDVLSTEDISSENLEQKTKPYENKEIKFLERVHKEHISNEIRERNREKLRSQDSILKPSNLSLETVSSEQNTDTQEIKESEIDIQPLIQELFLETSKEDCIKIVNIEDSIGDLPTIKLSCRDQYYTS